MKYLSNYMEEEQTALFTECGVFFAFSEKQLNEGMTKIGVTDVKKLIAFDGGMVCLKEHKNKLLAGLDDIYKRSIQKDLAENGKKAIIHRELANHECQISMDITDCINKLEDYPITKEEIQAEWKEYFQKCIDNDYF